jgi:DNA-binding MarR family transcriptional regulator
MSDDAPERLARELERLLLLLARTRASRGEGPLLTVSQRAALVAIVDEGTLRLGALARRLGTAEPTVTRIVDALEDLGLAARERESLDRRAVRVVATPAGERFLAERRRGLAELLAAPLDRLDPAERSRFVAGVAAMNDVLAEDAGDGPPGSRAG